MTKQVTERNKGTLYGRLKNDSDTTTDFVLYAEGLNNGGNNENFVCQNEAGARAVQRPAD